MSFLNEEIKKRRSIRKYQPKPVPLEIVKKLLETASYAPSAHNAQPWRFIVLTESEEKNLLADAMAQVWLHELEKDHIPKNTRWETVNTSVERFTSAPVLVVVCLNLEKMDKYPDKERQANERDLAIQSVAAATQNFLLAAHNQGLGACWYCAPIFCKKEVRQVLKINEETEPQALITLGYPNETPKIPHRNPLPAFAYKEKWGNPLSKR